MGWEYRNGSRYYYRKERSAGRVRSVYVGQGEIAILAATLDETQREEYETQRNKERQERRALATLDKSIKGLDRLASTLTEAVLITAGFHQHKGQWRKLKA